MAKNGSYILIWGVLPGLYYFLIFPLELGPITVSNQLSTQIAFCLNILLYNISKTIVNVTISKRESGGGGGGGMGATFRRLPLNGETFYSKHLVMTDQVMGV